MAERLIIIGSGPAGWTAAIYASRGELKPLLFEGTYTDENRIAGTLPLGQLALTTEVENYPGFPAGNLEGYLDSALPKEKRLEMPPHSKHGIHGPELLELMRQQAVNFGTRIVSEDITRVDFSRRPFRLSASDGKTYEADAVIVATGARANYLGLPSEEKYKNRGVSGCAVCEGALPRFRHKPLAVIGGGDSAVEEATYLAKFASKVFLVHRRDKLRASKIMAERAAANTKIEILWNRSVDEVLGNEQHGVTGVRLRSTVAEPCLELPISGFFLGIGHTPNTTFLQGALEVTDKGYIVWTTPGRTFTSVPGVFAAGDVADDYYRQAVTAAGTGCMAALDAERFLTEHGT
jgi:thioredoxin reductase (NADPH)